MLICCHYNGYVLKKKCSIKQYKPDLINLNLKKTGISISALQLELLRGKCFDVESK